MKAISFIQFYWEYHNVQHISKHGQPALCIQAYHELLSREFKPEMIIMLFEQWDKTKWAGGSLLYQIGDTSRFWIEKNRAHYATREEGKMWDDKGFPIPNTVNDFICDCSRAGIELTFKPEVVNKIN